MSATGKKSTKKAPVKKTERRPARQKEAPWHGQPDLSVVMPAYNEILTIREILRRVDAVPITKEIIVVDDGSSDGTREALSRLEASWVESTHPNSTLKVVFQPQNGGKGKAIRTGFEHATGKVTIVQDADLEYDPNDYPKLVDPILAGTADVVYGSRFAGTPRRVLYFWHSLGNQALTLMSNMLTDLNLTDMETCYKAFRTEIIQSIPLREDRFGIEPEITAKVARLGLRIYEVPISYHGRSYEEGKKIGWRDGVEALRVMVRNWAVDEVDDSRIGRRTLEIMKKSGRYNGWLFGHLAPWLGQRVLEVGSGTGNISRRLLDRELLVATEVDEENRRSLANEIGEFENVMVADFDLEDAPPRAVVDAEVDTVLCCNVLEHVRDDDAALRHMREVLQPGGKLVLLVPGHSFAYGTLDQGLSHHRRYEKQGLEHQVQDAGFKVVHTEHLNGVGLIGWTAASRVFKQRLVGRNQVGTMEKLVPWLELEEKLPLPFGLSLLVVAEAV